MLNKTRLAGLAVVATFSSVGLAMAQNRDDYRDRDRWPIRIATMIGSRRPPLPRR